MNRCGPARGVVLCGWLLLCCHAAGAAGLDSLQQPSPLGLVQFSVQTWLLQAPATLYTPVQPDTAQTRQRFGQGLFPDVGSGLAFKGRSGTAVDFYGVTDRGPNTDAPARVRNPTGTASKTFPVPDYAPGFASIRVDVEGARVLDFTPLRWPDGHAATGLPPRSKSAEGIEVPLTAEFRADPKLPRFDTDGLDPEAIVLDVRRKTLWISDEYGPYVLRIDPQTGVIRQRIGPGTAAGDLPAVVAKRRSNRGFENLTLDIDTQHLVAVLQSPIDPLDATGKSVQATPAGGKPVDVKHAARFIRWVDFDPDSGRSRSYAYPVDGAWYDKGRTGAAKLGDVASLGDGRFLVIEQGNRASDGAVQHWLMLVQVPADATDIVTHDEQLEISSITGRAEGNSDWRQVVPLRKTRLLDLDAAGWNAEKAEGLAVVDAHTIALINDNDYAIGAQLLDAAGNVVQGTIEDCALDAATGRLSDCPTAAAVSARVVPLAGDAHRVQLWMIRFAQPLSHWQLP